MKNMLGKACVEIFLQHFDVVARQADEIDNYFFNTQHKIRIAFFDFNIHINNQFCA